jgi:AcrR family transcriptional regulator
MGERQMQEFAIDDSEDVKRRIIEAACDLFTTVGYNGTTVRMITQRAGIDSRGFYYLFGSKEELLGNVVGHITDDEVAQLADICRQTDDTYRSIISVVEFILGCRRTRGLLVTLVEKRSATINNMFRENIMLKASPIVEELIQAGVAGGKLRVSKPAQTAKLIINSVSYVFYYMITGADRSEMLDMSVAFIQMLCSALGLGTDAADDDIASMQKLLTETA